MTLQALTRFLVTAPARSGRRVFRCGLFLCLLACWVFTCTAQEYVFRSFRQAHGLDNLSVTAIASDAQGTVWVGTENGLYRFLGESFQRFGVGEGLREKHINIVLGAPDGTLWVGTGKDLYRWNGFRFEPAASQPIPTGDEQSVAAEDPGHLLLIVDNQLQRLSYGPDGRVIGMQSLFTNRFAVNPHMVDNRVVAVAPNHEIWMVCGQVLCNWKTGQLVLWDSRHGVPEESYKSISFSPNGSVWIMGERNVLELPRGASAFVDHTPTGFTLNEQFIQPPIVIDRSGRVLVSTNTGLQRWNGVHWQHFNKENGITTFTITYLLFDSNDDLWMGTFGSGVQQWIAYDDWEGWTDHQSLPSSSVWGIENHHRADVALGTEKGPVAVDPHTGLVRPLQTGEWKYGPVSAFTTLSNGTSLLGTVDGDILRMPAGSSRLEAIAHFKTFIYHIFQEPSGRIFALNYRQGLFEISDKPGMQEPTPVPEVKALLGPSLTIFQACTTGDGSSWFVGRYALLHYDHAHWQRVEVEGIPPAPYQLHSLTCARDGSIWLNGRESGLWKAVLSQGHLKALPVALPSGASSLSVLDIFADSRGWVWLATDNGLLVWNGNSWRHLTQESGLIWNDLNQFNLTEDSDGSLWAGTSGGAAHLLHPERLFAIGAPRIRMIEVRREDRVLPLTEEVTAPWAARSLSFQFAAPNVRNRSDLVFHYRIAGLQTSWTQTSETTARFTTLPSGRYAFEVYAEDSISGMRSPVLSLPLQILPPWWRTLWAYAAYVVFAILLLSLLYRLRTRQMVLRQRRLEALIAERTEQLEVSREQLRIQATHDGLTGLLNRNAVLEAFHAELQRTQRGHGAVTLVLADLDYFKKINDTYGHGAGDEALRRFAAALSESARPYDHVGRYGGEEFMLVLTGLESCIVQERLAALHASITDIQVTEGEHRFTVTCSLGAVCFDFRHPHMDANALVGAADEALYEAKRTGRNRFVLRGLSASGTETVVQDTREPHPTTAA